MEHKADIELLTERGTGAIENVIIETIYIVNALSKSDKDYRPKIKFLNKFLETLNTLKEDFMYEMLTKEEE
jgi:hypothetical protein